MIKFDLKNHRREVIGAIIVLFLLIGGISVFKYTSFNSGFEIVDDLGGNIFPSAILSCSHHGCASNHAFGLYVSGKSEVMYCRAGEIKNRL